MIENKLEKTVILKQYMDYIFSKEIKLKKSKAIEEENDYGNIEYKLKLVDSSSERI